ncbi:FHA domain-containing protein [Agromyces sp. MMS24-JH15]|uniref:FHA domain-containing protein n=1 Tax=Agromyces sp. MMS24-JH15 TaxID=3243765 RepID=UPI00374A8816
MFEYAPAPIGVEPGFAIVTGRFVTLFGHETGAEFAGELYALLEDDEAELADILDLLALGGGPPDCGIVEVVDDRARIVHVGVRGAVDVVMDGVASTRFSGPGGGAWVVGEAAGIAGLRLAIGRVREATNASALLPVQRGVVRTAEITIARVRDEPLRPRVDLMTRPIELPGLGRAADAFSGTAISTADATPDDLRPAGMPAPAPQAEAAPQPVPEHAPAPVLPTSTAPDPRRVDLARPARDADLAAVAGAAEAEAAEASATDHLLLVLPDGAELSPPVVFGRRPRAAAGEGVVHVVTPSPRREISGRHLEVRAEGGALVAQDLGSTNGTLVRSPGRAPRLLIHSAQVRLEAGDILDLGEAYLVAVATAAGARRSTGIGSVSPG